MTRDQINQVQTSFRSVMPFRDYAARVYYERLFEIDPAMEPLFAGTDLRVQGMKLMSALSVIVGSLRHDGDGIGTAGQAAVQHFGHRLEERHYINAGRALIAMLECILGHDWTHELWIAWAEAYAVITRTMTKARAAA